MKASFVAAAAAAVLIAPGAALGGTGIGKGIAPLGSQGPSPPPNHIQIGTVTAVDSATMNFSCHWKTGDWTYWITRGTQFRAGHDAASFADLKTGETVQVLFHFSGKKEMADLVVLSP